MVDVKREQFIETLEAVRPGLAQKEVVHQATHFAFSNGMVHTYNDEISVCHPTDCTLHCVVQADALYKLLTKVKDEIISLEVVPSSDTCDVEGSVNVAVKGKKFEAVLRGNDDVKLVKIDVEGVIWNPLPDDFMDMIESCLYSVSNDLSKPSFTCVHWTATHIESCDNYRLTRFMVNTPGIDDVGVLLPSSNLGQLKKYEPVEFCLDKKDGWAHFRTTGNCVFSCRIFEGKYSDLSGVLQMNDGATIKFPSTTSEIVERASVVADSETSGAEQVLVKISKGILTVSVKGEKGSFRESTPLRCKEEVSFQIRALALLNIMGKFSEAVLSDTKDRLRFSGDNMVYIIALVAE